LTEYPPIQVVDENDRPLRGAPMDEVHKDGLLHRIVIVILKDPEGRVLLQKRGPHVSTNPNTWDASAAGHVDEGEDYLTAALRELEEEVGVKGIELKEAAYYKSEDRFEWRKLNRFRKIYTAVIPSDTPIKFNPEEITEVRWFSLDELYDLVENHPSEIVSDFIDVLERLDDANHEY
jgi:16S rRNA (adenine1518-N6/adenine1519-N6)-dimethyltransferase